MVAKLDLWTTAARAEPVGENRGPKAVADRKEALANESRNSMIVQYTRFVSVKKCLRAAVVKN